jgi:hypothetical protein
LAGDQASNLNGARHLVENAFGDAFTIRQQRRHPANGVANLTRAASGDSEINLAAWIGLGPDRDYYSIGTTYVAGDGASITARYTTDAYYTGPQDTARPHLKWIASGLQGSYPTESPPTSYWSGMATDMVGAGYTGAWYECPTNEPENGGWSTANTITYWNACASAILAVDATAKVMGFCSGGIYADSPLTAVASFLAGATSTVAGFSNHMEQSHQNMGDIVLLREYIGNLKAQFATSGVPNLPLWFTETGIQGAAGAFCSRAAKPAAHNPRVRQGKLRLLERDELPLPDLGPPRLRAQPLPRGCQRGRQLRQPPRWRLRPARHGRSAVWHELLT